MLVLSRSTEQKIVIGDTVCITVLAIQGNRVRLGIEAPPAIRVDRAEIAALRDLTAAGVIVSPRQSPELPESEESAVVSATE